MVFVNVYLSRQSYFDKGEPTAMCTWTAVSPRYVVLVLKQLPASFIINPLDPDTSLPSHGPLRWVCKPHTLLSGLCDCSARKHLYAVTRLCALPLQYYFISLCISVFTFFFIFLCPYLSFDVLYPHSNGMLSLHRRNISRSL